jgi:diaminohydroxyphosphoribosylaminopyrimidine deaminase/5-amino-6-(5-phosphoribosylamino)uracil reductase
MSHEYWMHRCLELAGKGAGLTSPNPMVGCLIVHENKIIGEGYHFKAGLAHAEVIAIQQVKNKSLLPYSTLYVTLEPCVHFGKTPPCTNLIIEKKIPRVVIGAIDTNSKVAGKGVEKLQQNGVEVTINILQQECLALNKHFYQVHNHQKPYIYLKFAKSKFNKIGALNGKSIPLTNIFTNQITHNLRAQVDAILVGKNTFINDKPQLTCRWIKGKNPKKIVFTRGKNWDWITSDIQDWIVVSNFPAPAHLKLNNIVVSEKNWKEELAKNLLLLNIQSVLIEGGKEILELFLQNEFYNEIWEFSTSNELNYGVDAPNLPINLILQNSDFSHKDSLRILTPQP